MRTTSIRRSALAGILVAALTALTFTGITAANATDTTADSWADVNAAVADNYNTDFTMTLGSDIAPPSGDGGEVVRTQGNVTINLNGHTLTTDGIILEYGTTLTIEDTAGGGELIADGSTNRAGGSNGVPGITVATDTELDIDSGTVDATGAVDQAALGGGTDVYDTIDGSRQLTGVGTISIQGGTVNATGGTGAAAIGGAYGEAGGSLAIADGASVTASTDNDLSVIGAGSSGSGFGSLDLGGVLNVAAGQNLTVPSGASATIESTGAIDGNGTVDAAGSIANGGAIAVPTVNNESNVTGNNYDVFFDSNSGVEPGALPAEDADESVRVFASNFVAGDRDEPLDFTAPGDYVFGWASSVEDPWSDTDGLSDNEILYAQWAPLTTITLARSVASAPDGSTVAVTVTGNGPSGTTNDQTPFATIQSSEGADVTGFGSVTLHGYGPRSILASVTSDANPSTTLSSNEVSVISTGALAKAMTISPAKVTIQAGVSATFEVSGEDSAGVNLGDITNQVSWSGWSASKHDSIDGATNEPIFGTAGTRTIKATIGSHSVTATVKVVAGAPVTLKFVKPVTTAVAGAPASFTVDGWDFAGNALGNVTNDSTFGAQNAVSGEGATGNLVTFTLAGARVATVTDGAATATTPITVTHGAAAQFNGLPIDGPPFDPHYSPTAGDTETYDGTSISGFTVQDVYGNVFSPADLANTLHITFSSYPDNDPISTVETVNKNTVTWVQQGDFWVNLTDGTAVAQFLQNVNAGNTVDGKLTFNFPTTTQYVGQTFPLAASGSDAEGNATTDSLPATFTSTGSGVTFTPDDADNGVTVKATTTGKHTITAKSTGYTSLSQSFDIVNDSSTPTFSSAPITASIASSLVVSLPVGGSGVSPAGTVTLHYGSKSIKQTVTAGDPSTATFSLPALKVGKYSFSTSYSGDSLYSAKTSSKATVSVVPGALDHLAFVKPATSVVAGKSVTFSVDGYDVNNNLIGGESAVYTVSSYDAGNGESIAANKLTLTDAGVRTVTATVGSVTKTTRITVKAATTASLRVSLDSTDPTAGVPDTFTATALDSHANPVLNSTGNVTAAVKVTSSVSSDKIGKGTVTFFKAGARTLTVSYGGQSNVQTVAVNPAAAAPGKYIFAFPSTKAYPTVAYNVQLATADAYGNGIAPVMGDAVYTATGTDAVIDAGNATVTFTKIGNHTVTATYDGVKVSRIVDVAKDKAIARIETGGDYYTEDSFQLQLWNGASGSVPTGTAVLHYGSHTLAPAALYNGGVAGDADATIPTAGKWVIYYTYSGSSIYNSLTSPKWTITVIAGSMIADAPTMQKSVPIE